jgi:ribonuclease BN (tRNA processing enzyme)
VRHAATAVLVDCGPGTAGRLALHVRPQALTGVAISHLHPDHYFDLVQLYYMLRFGDPRPSTVPPRLPVYVPPGGRAFLDRLGQLIADRRAMLEDVFELCEYAPAVRTDIGDLGFTFHPVQHYVPSHAMRIGADGGPTLVFSSDVGPCPELIAAARDADLFLCESALLDAAGDPDPVRRGHMSAADAGAAGRAAAAKRLVLTHFRSSPRDDEHHLTAASQTFGAPVELAREGQTLTVG